MAMIHVVVLALVFVSLMICSTRADEKLDRMKDDIKELHRRYTDLRMNDQNEEAEALRSEMESLVSLMRGPGYIADPVADDFARSRRDRYHDDLHAEMLSRHHRTRTHSHGSKADMEREKNEKFHNLIRGRVDDMNSKISRAPLSPEEASTLRSEVENYYRLELEVMESRAKTSQEFEKARDFHSKEERRAYLDKIKIGREARRDVDLKKREDAREIRARIEQRLNEALAQTEL